jgi:DNA-binding transcriptional LysR family regulator
MSEFDYLAMDGRALRLFLAVIEAQSVTGAAQRLGVTQSAVSHTLEKLRTIMRDPLFVKSGRGIVPTTRAKALATNARKLLDDMKIFCGGSLFDPKMTTMSFTVATTDYERELLLPVFFRRVSERMRGFQLRVISSGASSADLLRENLCDLLITADPPPGSDIIQKRLLQEHFVCFYDARKRAAPRTLDEYLWAGHIVIILDKSERLTLDKMLELRGMHRNNIVTVSNFSGVPAFLRGSNLIATLPSLLRLDTMREFRWGRLPTELPKQPELTIYMCWHRRDHLDPAHTWLRTRMEETTRVKCGENETGGAEQK